MRQVHGYSRVARVDLRPSQSARLRIERRGGEPLFDFRVTTGSDAFRIVEGEDEDAPRAARYVHAIGDSYTMGWGVDAPLSYPAQLARRLGPGLAVLNLGVDGFGAIGATAKSRALADRYPPAAAVYLFCPNDLDDDVQAAAVARRGKAAHAAYEAFDVFRRASYLAGVPFALRYRLQFRAGAAGTEAGWDERERTRRRGRAARADEIAVARACGASGAAAEQRTFAALREYRDFLQTRGARLVVLVLSNQHESLMAYRFCKEQGIEAHLFDVPPGMRIPDEGHFNALGNATVAALVERAAAQGPERGRELE